MLTVSIAKRSSNTNSSAEQQLPWRNHHECDRSSCQSDFVPADQPTRYRSSEFLLTSGRPRASPHKLFPDPWLSSHSCCTRRLTTVQPPVSASAIHPRLTFWSIITDSYCRRSTSARFSASCTFPLSIPTSTRAKWLSSYERCTVAATSAAKTTL